MKKAVSPLISTILLVSFAVAMGAVVMNWGDTFFKEQATDVGIRAERATKCSFDIIIKILEIDNQKFVCYNRSNSNNFEVIVENQGSESADGLQIFLLDYNDEPYTFNVIQALGAHNRTKYNVSLGAGFGFPPLKAILSPIISSQDYYNYVCSDNRIEIEEIDAC